MRIQLTRTIGFMLPTLLLACGEGTPLETETQLQGLESETGAEETVNEGETLAETETIEVHEAKMVLDCRTLEGDARTYAVENGICPADAWSGARSSVTRECGTSKFEIRRRSGTSAWFDIDVRSSQGRILSIWYEIPWSNSNAFDRQGNERGSAYPLKAHWGKSIRVGTSSGRVCGKLGGAVVVGWGATCQILHPVDCTTI